MLPHASPRAPARVPIWSRAIMASTSLQTLLPARRKLADQALTSCKRRPPRVSKAAACYFSHVEIG